MFFFEVVLFLIFLAEAVILNLLVPLVNVYMMIQVMGNLTGEEFLSQFAELLEKLTGLAARGPMLPSPRTAVPFEITATRLPLPVYL